MITKETVESLKQVCVDKIQLVSTGIGRLTTPDDDVKSAQAIKYLVEALSTLNYLGFTYLGEDKK